MTDHPAGTPADDSGDFVPAASTPTDRPALSSVSRRRLLQGAGLGAATVVGAVVSSHSAAAAPAAELAPAATGAPVPAASESALSVAKGDRLTTNQGLRISNDQNTLRAGPRGPALLEDLAFREKIMHFDHERMPERVVHARGAGAHGTFKLHTSLSRYTTAKVLTDTATTTEVFVRFSTVNGSRGSADTGP